MISISRWANVLAFTALLGIGLPASGHASSPTFQPLTTSPGQEHLPGKFIWADLFTTDASAAAKFYTGLFGWTTTTIKQNQKAYTVFSNNGTPVAGLVLRPASKSKRPSRWISYISVADMPGTLAATLKAGGQVRAGARDFPDRGAQAIIADSEGSTIGVLESSSGDPVDDEPKPGAWNWFELYVKNPQASADFYKQIFHYDIAPDTRTERKDDYLLSTGDLNRAGVAPLPDEREDEKPGWLGVIRVASIDATVAQATKLGGEVLLAPREAKYESRFAIIADPTGGTIGLVEYVDNANPAAQKP